MNEQVPKAAFSFKGYKINSFSFTQPAPDKVEYAINFDPKGEYKQEQGDFIIDLMFKCFFGEEKEFVDLSLTATFHFPNSPEFSEIPPFFYRNSIAIIFPYIRSFITTLTAVCNIQPLVLPLLNLSQFEKILKDNSTVATNEKKEEI